MNTNKLLKAIFSAVLVSVVSSGNVFANPEENHLKLSEKLVALRGQVSDLSTQLQHLRDEHKLEMQGLLSQKNSTASLISQEDIEIKRLQESLIENKKLIKNIGADRDTIKQALLLEAENLKVYVNTGLPFKVDERLRSINDYVNNLQADVLYPHRAAANLWSMIEDELKLANSTGLYRQSVTLDNKEHLADVIKAGMVMMYFRLGDDQFGLFRKTSPAASTASGNNKWMAKIVDGNDAAQIKNLFSSLEKQIRVGYFELPNALH